MDIYALLIYTLIVFLLLAVGDRIGMFGRRLISYRHTQSPLPHLPNWAHFFIYLLTPFAVLAGILGLSFDFQSRNALEMLADNIDVAIIGAFFVTGLLGGFFAGTKKY